ncbi:hypothetical protein RB195_023769 [Necator americanus]|uniref:Uncharacterized protein n=1 Tax=Necator americanus TaxID=51031 RepID=A0ABR1EKL1_NECAM
MSMRLQRVPEEYVRWTKLLYAKPTSVVRCAVGTSRPFPVRVEVHQGDIDKEGRARVNAAWMKWKMATGVLCDRKVPVRLKSKINKMVVRPVALYGCECWPTTKALERVLHADADVEVDDRCNAKKESI